MGQHRCGPVRLPSHQLLPARPRIGSLLRVRDADPGRAVPRSAGALVRAWLTRSRPGGRLPLLQTSSPAPLLWKPTAFLRLVNCGRRDRPARYLPSLFHLTRMSNTATPALPELTTIDELFESESGSESESNPLSRSQSLSVSLLLSLSLLLSSAVRRRCFTARTCETVEP